jgi:hypothetical protein
MRAIMSCATGVGVFVALAFGHEGRVGFPDDDADRCAEKVTGIFPI